MPAFGSEQAGAPPSNFDHIAATKTGEPTQQHRKKQNEQNTNQKSGQRHPQQRQGHEQLTAKRATSQCGIHPHGNAQQQSHARRYQSEL